MRSVFVRAVGGEFASLGIGKQVDRQGDSCSVEYFDSPTSEAIVRTVDARSVEPVALAKWSVFGKSAGSLMITATVTSFSSPTGKQNT